MSYTARGSGGVAAGVNPRVQRIGRRDTRAALAKNNSSAFAAAAGHELLGSDVRVDG